MPPDVAAGLHLDGLTGTPEDDHRLDAVGLGQRLIDVFLQRHGRAPAEAAVGGEHEITLGVFDAVGDRLAGEAAEDDGVGCADPGAGEHGDGRLGDHGQIDGDAVAFFDADFLERVGKAADFVLELAIGVGGDFMPAVFDRLAFEGDGGLVAVAEVDLALKAVVGEVGLGADEPPGVGHVPVEHFRPGRKPVKLAGDIGPELLGLIDRPAVKAFVLFA